MRNKHKNGGSAFPVLENGQTILEESPGMSLRDYFAAAALQALIQAVPEKEHQDYSNHPYYANEAYGIADAMLEVRSK